MTNFLEAIKQFSEEIRFKYIVIIIFIITLIMLYNPFDLLNILKIYETINIFTEKYKDVISITFLTTIIILSIMVFLSLKNVIKNFIYLLKILFSSKSREYSILSELKRGETLLAVDDNATIDLYSHNIIYTNNRFSHNRVGHSLGLNYKLKLWAYIFVYFKI